MQSHVFPTLLRNLLLQLSARSSGSVNILPLGASAAVQHTRTFSALPETVSSSGDDADESRKWFTDPNISARAAAKIVTKRLHKYGPQRVSHLMELVRRIQTPEEAAEAIEVAQIFAMHRARRQQHDGISPHLSTFLLKKVLEAGEVTQALKVLERSPELQLTFRASAFRHVIIRAGQQGNLRAVISALELMKVAGLRPNRDIAYHVVRAFFENDRQDLAVAFSREFEANGLPPRPSMREKVDAAAADPKGAAAARQEAGAQKAAVEGGDQAAGQATMGGTTT